MINLSYFVVFIFLFSNFIYSEKSLDKHNSWAFHVTKDSFKQEALLDLRDLNEIESGQNGFVKLSEDGNDLVLANGEPFRIWMIGSEGHLFSPEDMDHHTRWLAKLGRVWLTISCDDPYPQVKRGDLHYLSSRYERVLHSPRLNHCHPH